MSFTAIADARITRGMQSQLATRRELLSAGARHLGWKVGFGSGSAMQRLGTSAPLFGFLVDRTLVESGSTVSIDGWVRPVFEAEVAVHLGAGGSVAGMGAAIELADSDPAIADVETILAGDIFHRYVVLGPVRSVDSVEGLVVRVLRDGEEIARTSEPSQLTGEIGPVLQALRELLEQNGETLRAGDIVITGSVVPPIEVARGQRLRTEMSTLGSVEVSFEEVGR
jgi:2-keto-4-pentenoate hydratase